MKQLIISIAGEVGALLLVMPAAAKQQPANTATTHNAAMLSAWPPENLSGTITMADPQKDLVVVKGPDGVPFDMTIKPRTSIRSGNRKVSRKELEQFRDKQVSVRFVPERRGDVA